MSPFDPNDLKRRLKAAGFEIYRSSPQAVRLAERVRDNLIMDSGVEVVPHQEGLAVRVTLRAQASHYPGAGADRVWEAARALTGQFLDSGYQETQSRSELLTDPSDPSQSLDTSHEIELLRGVSDETALFAALRDAMSKNRSTGDE